MGGRGRFSTKAAADSSGPGSAAALWCGLRGRRGTGAGSVRLWAAAEPSGEFCGNLRRPFAVSRAPERREGKRDRAGGGGGGGGRWVGRGGRPPENFARRGGVASGLASVRRFP